MRKIPLSRSALRDWLGTFATNLMLLVVSIVTGIVAARFLGPQGRGEFAQILFWGNFVAQLGAFGLSSAVTMEVARNSVGERLMATVLLLSLAYSAFSVAIFALAVVAGVAPASGFVVAFVAAYVPANILGLSFLSADAGAQRFGLLNAMRTVPQLVYLIAMLLLTVTGLASAVAFAWGVLAGSALVPVIRGIGLNQTLFRRPDIVVGRRMVFSGLKFYSTSVIGVVREASDKLIILVLLDTQALGLYAVALTVAGSAIQNVAGATTTILLPKVVAAPDHTAKARQLAMATSATMVVAALLNGLIAIAIPYLIPILFGRDFSGAVPIALALCLAQTARSGAEILSYGLNGLEDWKAMPFTAGVALVVFVPLGFLGAREYGPAGVAAALAVSNVAALVFVYHRAVPVTNLPLIRLLVPPLWMFSPKTVWARLHNV